jgi:hypothetical protein
MNPFKNKRLKERTTIILLQQRIEQLEAREEKLLDRLMAKDYSEFQASQIKQEDDQLKADAEDDPYIDLEDVLDPNANQEPK